MDELKAPSSAPTTAPVSPANTSIPQPDALHPAEHSVLSKSESTDGVDSPVRITIILPTNAYFMSGIREFTMTVVQRMTGFTEQWAYRFQSVVDELTNNAIEFGSAPGKDIRLTFISQKNQYVEVYVEDTGTGPQKRKAEDIQKIVEENMKTDPASFTSVRGRGLAQIVASWTDVLDFKNNNQGGITVRAYKSFTQ